MSNSISNIRNIGIIAHIDAGKTTTTERILYYTGAQHRMGDVDDGTTTTDFDPDEARRGITIYSAAISCQWRGTNINIIDTPGHVDFTAEVERSLRVLDGAVVIFSAVEGVEAQSETVWRQADHYRVPRVCYINKLDRIGADFDRTVGQIKERLHGEPVVLQIPHGTQQDLHGVIDLIGMQGLRFTPDSKGEQIETYEIPDELAESAARWRQELLDTIAMVDDEAMNVFLETEDIPVEIIHRVLRQATVLGKLQPTFCGASLDYIGVQPVLDAVIDYLPSPLDRPAVEGVIPAQTGTLSRRSQRKKKAVEPGAVLKREPSDDEPLCALVFKIQADSHGDMCFTRVYSGVLRSSSRVLNARTGKKEFANQLWKIQADSRAKLEEARAGEIVGVIGPKEAVTGDTLCDPQHPVILETILFPETVISMAVEPDSSDDRKKLADALARLARQDPTFTAHISEETGQTIVSGMGELHLEVIRDRMERDFNLKVRVHKPRVSYRETIRAAVEAEHVLQRQLGQQNQFARIKLRLEPVSEDGPAEVDVDLPEDALSAEFEKLALESLEEEMNAGGPLGFPLTRLRVTLVDAETREGETTDMALQSCISRAIQEAFEQASSVLLEPVMKLEVVTPEEFLGNIQADLNARRAAIVGSQPRGHLTAIEAHVSLAQMFGYSTQVRSLSQGRASYSMEPLRYEEAPKNVLESVLGMT